MAKIFGIKVQSGTAKKTGNPYCMVNVFYATGVIDDVSRDSLQITHYGIPVITRQMQLRLEDVSAFEKQISNIKFPAYAELIEEVREFAGKFESQLTGLIFIPVPAQKTA